MAEVDYDEDRGNVSHVAARNKGRGHRSDDGNGDERYHGRGGVFETISQPNKS